MDCLLRMQSVKQFLKNGILERARLASNYMDQREKVDLYSRVQD